MSKVAREAAAAVHRAVHKKLESDSRGRVELGFIRDFRPLRVEMAEAAEILEGEVDVFLSQFLHWWDSQYGLAVGDTLLLASIREGVWLAFDVRSQHPTKAGIRPGAGVAGNGTIETDAPSSSETGLFTLGAVPSGGGTPSVTWNRHITHKLPVYDKAGALIGWVPVFTSLP